MRPDAQGVTLLSCIVLMYIHLYLISPADLHLLDGSSVLQTMVLHTQCPHQPSWVLSGTCAASVSSLSAASCGAHLFQASESPL